MSLRSKVWNGLTPAAASPPAAAYEPVISGMFWPTRNFASSLSSVWIVGVDRMLASAVVSSARARNARLSTSPTPGMLILPLMTPRFRPWPTEPRLAAVPMMLVPAPPKFWLATTPTSLLLTLPSACHWTPNSAALSAVISTISDSMTTCARRTSSLSMIARMFRYSGSGAVMISELVAASAWISPASGPLPPPPPPPPPAAPPPSVVVAAGVDMPAPRTAGRPGRRRSAATVRCCPQPAACTTDRS